MMNKDKMTGPWVMPTRTIGEQRKRITYRFDEPFSRSLRWYADRQSIVYQRKISRETVLKTAALQHLPEINRKYLELKKEEQHARKHIDIKT